MKEFYIYSTLSTPTAYTTYKKGGGDIKIVDEKVVIEGGANVAKKSLETPKGVMTKITEAEYNRLKTHPVFKMHLKNGFISVDEKPIDVDKKVASLKKKDKSAQITEAEAKLKAK